MVGPNDAGQSGRPKNPRGVGARIPALSSQPTCDFFTIGRADVSSFAIRAFGRAWPVTDFIGRIMLQDVGKRVYLRGEILQVENHKQFAARLAKEVQAADTNDRCECGEHTCPLTLDTGKHPAGDVCGLPGEMHLFPLQRGNEPTIFCDGCGDDAMQGGLYTTGEDIAQARRMTEGRWRQW